MRQKICFSTADQPLGEAGMWRITACQKVGQQTFSNTFTFAQRGVRYALPSNSVYEQFPPPQQQGDFSHILPHILLRGLTGAGSLCLLLLTQEDGFLVRQGTLGDFSNLATGWYAPAIKPLSNLGEDEQTPCTELILPWARLQKALPHPEDLPYLSHLRSIATLKRKAAQTLEDGTLLCLFSHRPPPMVSAGEQQVTVCLVPLEGIEQWSTLAPDATIQLPLLHYWSFRQQRGSLDFGTIACRLSGGYLGARESALPLLQQGYVPLQHHLRNGEQTVSWYRGPLTPIPIPPVSLPQNSDIADAYTKYDPENGMLDVSRSAAWQIGHLLALRSGKFSSQLQELRRQRRRFLLLEQERQALSAKWGAADAKANTSTDSWAQQLDKLCANCLAPTRSVASSQTPSFSHPALWSQAKQVAGERQTAVEEWLQSLCLLQDVPFEYLVPREDMLPPESLRLFYLDDNWLEALRQGALAVGRQGVGDRCHDSVCFTHSKPLTDSLPCGFLLRSQMVSLWKGMEVHAYFGTGQTPCSLLRLERLGEDVLIGIFQQGFSRLEFLEPPECLHLSCIERRFLRDPHTALATSDSFVLRFRADSSVDFAATAADYPIENQPIPPDIFAMQLLQTAQKFVVFTMEE